ncbi:MAG: hypothetical protein K2X67_04250 [Burkholderiales bacterium]|nr:hypothetical protein [Burkholderiales bacterium]
MAKKTSGGRAGVLRNVGALTAIFLLLVVAVALILRSGALTRSDDPATSPAQNVAIPGAPSHEVSPLGEPSAAGVAVRPESEPRGEEGLRVRDVRVHVVTLFALNPEEVTTLKAQIGDARRLFIGEGVSFNFESAVEHRFEDGHMDVGNCDASEALTRQQIRVFADLDGIPAHEVVVLVARGLGETGYAGCAMQRAGREICAIDLGGPNSPTYVLAHELGHLLGMSDRPMLDGDRWLMSNGGGWSQIPPLLDAEERKIIAMSNVGEKPLLDVAVTDSIEGAIDAMRIEKELRSIEPKTNIVAAAGALAAPVVQKLLRDPSPAVRNRAIYATRFLRDGRPVLREFLATNDFSDDAGARRAAAYALTYLVDSLDEPEYERLLRDEDQSVLKAVLSRPTGIVGPRARGRLEKIKRSKVDAWLRPYVEGVATAGS